jgi:hypothetical protein
LPDGGNEEIISDVVLMDMPQNVKLFEEPVGFQNGSVEEEAD